MHLEESDLYLTIGARVDKESGKPKVIMMFTQHLDESERILMTIALSPLESRSVAQILLEHAEGAEQVALATIGMREQKIPEDVIQEVLVSMERKRNRFS